MDGCVHEKCEQVDWYAHFLEVSEGGGVVMISERMIEDWRTFDEEVSDDMCVRKDFVYLYFRVNLLLLDY